MDTDAALYLKTRVFSEVVVTVYTEWPVSGQQLQTKKKRRYKVVMKKINKEKKTIK